MKRVSINRSKTTPYKRERFDETLDNTNARDAILSELAFLEAICPSHPDNLVFQNTLDRIKQILTDEALGLILRRVDFVEWWVLETDCGKKDTEIFASSGNGKSELDGKKMDVKTINDVADVILMDNKSLMIWTNTFYANV